MQIGVVGLGRMGGAIVKRLLRGGHTCVVFDRDPRAVADVTDEGATAAKDLDDLAAKLQPPRLAWVMLPAGQITDDTVMALGERFAAGDAVIDGGNSFYRDDIRRAKALQDKGVGYLDVGTSGGVWGWSAATA